MTDGYNKKFKNLARDIWIKLAKVQEIIKISKIYRYYDNYILPI